tara:strand:+ start:358 stop:1143 length:786 start_codon:yes stop_codon:yes gene_type:complete
MLKYSDANTKISKLYDVPELAEWLDFGRFTAKVYSLDLLSGHSCPFAEKCHSKAVEFVNAKTNKVSRKVVDGEKTEHRCYSASQEAQYTGVYNRRKHNFDMLKECTTSAEMLNLFRDSMPRDAGIVRQHVGGDFFNSLYFRAWLDFAAENPKTLFYAYTKSLNYWIDNIELVNALPNVRLTASRGGRLDSMIEEHNLRESVVVLSEVEAHEMGLELDYDDSHAALKGGSFALLIHGTQPANSEAAKALVKIKLGKREGVKS